jgi:hypothetical protein
MCHLEVAKFVAGMQGGAGIEMSFFFGAGVIMIMSVTNVIKFGGLGPNRLGFMT